MKLYIPGPSGTHSEIQPQERIAIVGKTRSGKTTFAMLLAAMWVRSLPAPWEVWWLDTKGDENDIRSLRQWGFRNAIDAKDLATTKIPHAKYWAIRSGKGMPPVWMQAQSIIRLAYETRKIVLVIDEYTQVVPSKVSAGKALSDVFARGGGLNVGLIGLTQEPVYVPRMLLSQSTHQALFTVTYQYDIDYLRKMHPEYVPPSKLGDIHGFWWKWIDGNAKLIYYKNQAVWYDTLYVGLPKKQQDKLPSPDSLKGD